MLYIFSCIVCVCGLTYEQVVTISRFKGIPMTAVNPGEDGMVVFSQMTLEDLLAEVRQYLSPQDVESIQRAYTEASRAHLGTLRRSGEPFIQHPLEVSRLLADMRIDADGIVARLVMDVVEENYFRLDELRRQVGDAVANIVDGVSKFEALAGKPIAAQDGIDTVNRPPLLETSEQIEQKQRLVRDLKRRQRSETVRKMLLAMAEDPRVVVLKLADRLHNMRTMSVMNPAQQQNKARETREIYAPHAWQKHLASINSKLEQSGDELSQIHDLVSYRILVDSVQDCYLALGHIHALWRPKDGRIKDFIATPKLNGYQSLHTMVFCLDNQLAEIQIRTHEMQRIADYGIASYWYLKERGGARLSTREMIAWIEQLRELQRELPQNADEFVEAVQGDIIQEQILVVTLKSQREYTLR